MRCAIVLLALAAFGAALPQQQQKQRAADQNLLKKQQDVMLLLQQITQEIPNEQLQVLGITYDIQNNLEHYDNPTLVKYYVGAVQAGLVQPKGTAHSSSISQLRKEVALLQRVLLGAKNYQTFLATAAWARVHVNEEQFVKAFVGVVLQHPETQGVIVPPFYEILPQSYFDARVIQDAQNVAVQSFGQNPVVIPVNYTANLPDEQQLSYFTQDIGLANYYAFVNLAGSSLQNVQQQTPVQYQGSTQNQESQIGQGALYYYLHQQLLAHYELNRLANGLGPIQNTDYVNVQAPYQPHFRHINGLEFPARSSNLRFTNLKNKLVNTVKKIEQRLVEAIDSGNVITSQGTFLSLFQPQGLNILGELIQGMGKSVNPRYYGSLQAAARQLLGNAPEVQNIYDYTPSVLEVGRTAVYDPAFYQLYKKVIQLFQHYQNSLPAYQYNDILLPGVSIENVQISSFVTFFNDDYVDLESATGQQQQARQQVQQHQQRQQQQQQQVKAQLKRLDHKPYTYQITVNSEQNVVGAVVRVYLGPKYDYHGKPISISQHRHQFVELDQFMTDLQQGRNVIVRQSQQAPSQSFDYPSVQEIKQSVNSAVHAQEPFYITEPHQIFGFPARLVLPKGQQGQGFPVQLLVVISQSGQQNPSYGPVIPEQFQTYQQNEYQVVSTEEYLQHQTNKGLQQTMEVVPENLPIGQQVNQAVRNHHANLYTQQHGQYPYTHTQYQVGQGQNNMQGQWLQGQQTQNQWLQEQQSQNQWLQGQQTQNQWAHEQQNQNVQSQQRHLGQMEQQAQNVQGQQAQNVQGHLRHFQGQQQWSQKLLHGQNTVGVQGMLTADAQKMQQNQGVKNLQNMQGMQVNDNQSGLQSQFTYQQQQGFGLGNTGSGKYHAGGFQNVLHQGQKDSYISKYYQNKHISEIIGGAISLDGKPLGYPLDKPLSTGALLVPNMYVQTTYIHHEGQPSNEMFL